MFWSFLKRIENNPEDFVFPEKFQTKNLQKQEQDNTIQCEFEENNTFLELPEYLNIENENKDVLFNNTEVVKFKIAGNEKVDLNTNYHDLKPESEETLSLPKPPLKVKPQLQMKPLLQLKSESKSGTLGQLKPLPGPSQKEESTILKRVPQNNFDSVKPTTQFQQQTKLPQQIKPQTQLKPSKETKVQPQKKQSQQIPKDIGKHYVISKLSTFQQKEISIKEPKENLPSIDIVNENLYESESKIPHSENEPDVKKMEISKRPLPELILNNEGEKISCENKNNNLPKPPKNLINFNFFDTVNTINNVYTKGMFFILK